MINKLILWIESEIQIRESSDSFLDIQSALTLKEILDYINSQILDSTISHDSN